MASQVQRVQQAKMASQVRQVQQVRTARTDLMAKRVLRVQRAKMASKVRQAHKGQRVTVALPVRIFAPVLGISLPCSIYQRGLGSITQSFAASVIPLNCRLTGCEARRGSMRF
jgi:hypothetical protein